MSFEIPVLDGHQAPAGDVVNITRFWIFRTESETVKFPMQICTIYHNIYINNIYQYVAISHALKMQLASAVESPSDRVVYKPGVLSPSILISGSSKRMCQQKDLSFT